MHKLVLLFYNPPDGYEFEIQWSNDFVPIAEKMPGIQRIVVSRVYGAPGEEIDFSLIHEFYFESKQALQEAMTSPEGKVAGEALMSFAADFVSIVFAQHFEEGRGKSAEAK